jgi:hypothetical protein
MSVAPLIVTHLTYLSDANGVFCNFVCPEFKLTGYPEIRMVPHGTLNVIQSLV